MNIPNINGYIVTFIVAVILIVVSIVIYYIDSENFHASIILANVGGIISLILSGFLYYNKRNISVGNIPTEQCLNVSTERRIIKWGVDELVGKTDDIYQGQKKIEYGILDMSKFDKGAFNYTKMFMAGQSLHEQYNTLTKFVKQMMTNILPPTKYTIPGFHLEVEYGYLCEDIVLGQKMIREGEMSDIKTLEIYNNTVRVPIHNMNKEMTNNDYIAIMKKLNEINIEINKNIGKKTISQNDIFAKYCRYIIWDPNYSLVIKCLIDMEKTDIIHKLCEGKYQDLLLTDEKLEGHDVKKYVNGYLKKVLLIKEP